MVDACGVDGLTFSGVVSSLVKKGLIDSNPDEPGERDSACMNMTPAGVAVYREQMEGGVA